MSIWTAGDTTAKLTNAFKDYLVKWMYHEDYKDRLPDEHIHVLSQGDKQHAGVKVVVVVSDDPIETWSYTPTAGADSGKGIVDEHRELAVVIISDIKSGGKESLTKVYGVVKSLVLAIHLSSEKSDLISSGIYDIFETANGIEVDLFQDYEEGDTFIKQLDVVCKTTSYIK